MEVNAGNLFKCKSHDAVFNDILARERPLQASFSPKPRMRNWSIDNICIKVSFKRHYKVNLPNRTAYLHLTEQTSLTQEPFLLDQTMV